MRVKSNRQMSPEWLEHLVGVAREVFEERGVGNATIDQVASRAGVSKASIYRQFDNKEDLFAAVALHVSKQLSAELGRFELDFDDPAASLFAAALSIRKAHLATREFVRLIIAEMERHPEICARARDSLGSSMFQRLYSYFEALHRRQQMSYGDTDSATRLFSLIAMGGFRPLIGGLASVEEETARIQSELQIFIRGCGIGGAGAAAAGA